MWFQGARVLMIHECRQMVVRFLAQNSSHKQEYHRKLSFTSNNVFPMAWYLLCFRALTIFTK